MHSDLPTPQADPGPTDQDPLPPRGSFPKGPLGETAAERRERYELFVQATHSRAPDYEAQSIKFYRDKTKSVRTGIGEAGSKEVPAAPSRRICATSRCWQCEHGDDDPNGHLRIAGCKVTGCGLWPVRPYQEFAQPPAPPKTGQGNYIDAVRTHCLQCMGGKAGPTRPRHFLPEVALCRVVSCALWPVRPGSQVGAEPKPADPAAESADEQSP